MKYPWYRFFNPSSQKGHFFNVERYQVVKNALCSIKKNIFLPISHKIQAKCSCVFALTSNGIATNH